MKLSISSWTTLFLAGTSAVGVSAQMYAPIADFPAVAETSPVVELNAGDYSCLVHAPVGRQIDLALCLDTSGSMSGLIDAAKQKLWDIVNELALAEPQPRLRVALLTYGNDGHTAENGWVQVQVPLSEDLDLVSQQLFALTTNGGTELVGRVVNVANGQLAWSDAEDALKLIVVAGNESADQDRELPYTEVCSAAIQRGIMVNAIYCGDSTDGVAPGWRDVARRADGQFASIDHHNGTVVIATPFDEELAVLSASINETYVPFGSDGARGLENQMAQDSNASGLSSSAGAGRALTKAGKLYVNSTWDLVDACNNEQVDLEKLEAQNLPVVMQTMTLPEQREYIAVQTARRDNISKEIALLAGKRQGFLDAELAKQAKDQTSSFDFALRKAVREQALSRGFRFQAPIPPAAPATTVTGVEGPQPQPNFPPAPKQQPAQSFTPQIRN